LNIDLNVYFSKGSYKNVNADIIIAFTNSVGVT